MRIRPFEPKACLASALALAGLAGCSTTPSYHAEYAERLAAAASSIDKRQLDVGYEQLIRLISDLSARGLAGYDVQRALATALMVELHAQADAESGFLVEPRESRMTRLRDQEPAHEVSVDAHRIATTFHAWELLDAAEQLETAPHSVEGVDVAPGRLADLLCENYAQDHAYLFIGASFASLGFVAEAHVVLENVDDPQLGRIFGNDDPQLDRDIVRLMARHRVPAQGQQQLLAVAYEHARSRHSRGGQNADPSLAFRLGCLAVFGTLEPTSSAPGPGEHRAWPVPSSLEADFHKWVDGLHGSFVSGSSTSFARGIRGCELNGKPAAAFTWVPRRD